MQETWVQFLGWDDPLEKEMATQPSILAWEQRRLEGYIVHQFSSVQLHSHV